jgi:hypothetical protein
MPGCKSARHEPTGRCCRIEEIHDAHYIEAYDRFGFHMMPVAEAHGG